MPSAEEQLQAINDQVQNCQACPLAAGRIIGVPGAGNAHAEVLLIGEGPGQKENETGLPFVGAAGKFLDQMLASINWNREDVFIGNVVKCRPPENRDPEPDEIKTCTDLYLWQQIEIIHPKLIVTLGRHSMGLFLPPTVKISQAHGQPKRVNGRVVLPLYHPAAALYQGSMRQTLMYDFKKIPLLLKKIKTHA